MDLTPLVPGGRQIIERYAASGFRVSGVIYTGSVLVFPERTLPWGPTSARAITLESLAAVVEHGAVRILLLGLGRRAPALAPDLRAALRGLGITPEPMDTGAACRTYNVLLGEDRPVAAGLLLPV
jgi:uncharacterized protein